MRINEDNSVRLIYAGTSTGDTAAFISTTQSYNPIYTNSSYVGYMYTLNEQHGTNTNSSVKTVVDNWYTSKLNGYDGYISKTAIYCNDRTVIDNEDTWSATGTSFNYASYTRVWQNHQPTFACSNVNDRFTASTSTGNGKLTYPIGLITADEVAYAGGKTGSSNTNYYIAQNASSGSYMWWTMSPYLWLDGTYSGTYMFGVGSTPVTGTLDWYGADYVSDDGAGVRPVISLKSCVQYNSGDGTASNPYTVSINSSCSVAEN